MNLQEFEAVQAELTRKLAVALSDVLRLLGDEAQHWDMVSVKPDLDRYHRSQQRACA